MYSRTRLTLSRQLPSPRRMGSGFVKVPQRSWPPNLWATYPTALADQAPGPPRRRVLILGAGSAGRRLAEELVTHFPEEFVVVGFVEDDPTESTSRENRILGRHEDIADLIKTHAIDEVMLSDFLQGRLGGVYTAVAAPPSGIAVDAEDPQCDRWEARASSLEKSSIVTSTGKRGLDILLSAAALVVGAPLVAAAAVTIKLTSRGPVFYCQERVGRHGRLFTIYKLRTMVDGAERETGPTLARKSDPRSTPVGRVLRAIKLDEWPQFYNVLRGDMSIVGPRPERLCFVQSYGRHIDQYSQRHSVRPGITGLAQVKGGYRTHVYVKLRYDLDYVRRQSCWLDLWILARTPLTILQGVIDERTSGAHRNNRSGQREGKS
jgi:exopolysaccharide biosynthesis polyprenyl glycosylphosphotransferase